jgi:hypothetical protein
MCGRKVPKKAFPGIAGFSSQNLWHMRAFYSAWTEAISNLQQPVGDLDGKNLPQAAGALEDLSFGAWKRFCLCRQKQKAPLNLKV